MEGDVAPLPELVEVCDEFDAMLLVDDAHGVGVLAGGRGTVAHFGLTGRIPVLTLTFSKSFGSQGGAVLSDAVTIDHLRHAARPLIYSAGLNPASTAAARAALGIIRATVDTEPAVNRAAAVLRSRMRAVGHEVPDDPTPIIPMRFPDLPSVLRAHRALLDQGIYVNMALPPASEHFQLRISVTDDHDDELTERVLAALSTVDRMPTSPEG